MNAAGKHATIQLRDGQQRSVDAEQVRAAANSWWTPETLKPGADTDDHHDERVTVLIDDRSFEALPLIARALNVDSDLLRPRSALNALRDLGFRFEGQPHAPGSDTIDDTAGNEDVEDTDYTEQADQYPEPPIMTAELARSLQRHRGQWVAVRDNQLIGFAATLKDLRSDIGPGVVSVLFVPTKVGAVDE